MYPTTVYVGTTSESRGTGLARMRFDPETGEITRPELAVAVADPALFVLSRSGSRLYLCHSSGISAYAVDATAGGLASLNHTRAEGRGPSHVSLDHTGRFVLAANYHGGFVEVYALAADGTLVERTAVQRHRGKSVHPERQTRAYPHCFTVDPTNRYAIAADLGTDELVVYRFDELDGTLARHDPPIKGTTPGSGPRHLAWHPGGTLYVVNELSSAVSVLSWDAALGRLSDVQTISTLPGGFAGSNTGAEILVHPNGRVVYASNRGHDSIAVFAVDDGSGRLALMETAGTGGRTPRYFAMDPSGRWLIASNRDSDTVVIFRIDRSTGRLARHGDLVAIGRPTGIAVVPSAMSRHSTT
jgi:6-phosphogluconolactonase